MYKSEKPILDYIGTFAGTPINMTDGKKDIKAKVESLRNELEQLFTFFEQGLDYHKMVYEFWNAKDILGHLTFWHESFARNISDLGMGIIPKPLKGRLSEVNIQSVETTKNVSTELLLERLKLAQGTIEAYIYQDSISIIPYKKGSRGYSRIEHLEIVSGHIRRHLRDLYKAYGTPSAQGRID